MTENRENSFDQDPNFLPVYYALIWKSSAIGPQVMQGFEERIPRLMIWLKELRASGTLVACGGGAFESSEGYSGGLTIIKANSFEQAHQISKGTPMNEIGKTEVMIWDLFAGNLQANTEWLAQS
jgi:uncharacterized protein YciI